MLMCCKDMRDEFKLRCVAKIREKSNEREKAMEYGGGVRRP